MDNKKFLKQERDELRKTLLERTKFYLDKQRTEPDSVEKRRIKLEFQEVADDLTKKIRKIEKVIG